MPTSAERVSENVPGDFYVVNDLCLRCCLPHGEAPELLNDLAKDFDQCYFRRQPQSPAETEQAIQAIHVSCVCALRYAGSDPQILARLKELGDAHQCDQLQKNHSPP